MILYWNFYLSIIFIRIIKLIIFKIVILKNFFVQCNLCKTHHCHHTHLFRFSNYLMFPFFVFILIGLKWVGGNVVLRMYIVYIEYECVCGRPTSLLRVGRPCRLSAVTTLARLRHTFYMYTSSQIKRDN